MIVYQTLTQLTSEEIETIFLDLVKQWQQETRGISASTELILHPAYQQIIGMGEKLFLYY